MGVAPVWSRLVGQERLAADLAQVVTEPHRMTHAWLFLGPAGSGRSTAAKCFAAALQCAEGGCDTCRSCHQVFTGNHPDVVVFATEGLSLKTDDARELVRDSGMSASGADWRVIIVEDADRLTQQASNALLKALEEPPPRTVWMLCAPSESADAVDGGVLPTIRSRCRLVSLSVPSIEAITELLVSAGANPDVAAWAAAAAQGHVGRARRLATDEESRARRASVLAIPPQLTSLAAAMSAAQSLVSLATDDAAAMSASRDEAETAELRELVGTGRGTAGIMKELADNQKSRATRMRRDTIDLSLIDLAAFYRDVLLVQVGSPVLPVHPDMAGAVRTVASQSSPNDSLMAIEAILACREALSGNVAPQLAMEQMLVRLTRQDLTGASMRSGS